MTDEIIPGKNWTSTSAYGLSLICLLVGVTVGFLLRGSGAHPAAATTAAVANQPGMRSSSNAAQMPTGAAQGQGPGNMTQPGPDQLKQMADKKAAPLIAELDKDPNNTAKITQVGSYYFAAQQFETAAQYYERAVKIKPTADGFTKLSNAYAYNRTPDKAIAALNQALKIDPTFADALFNLGMLKWQVQGDVNGAIACWEKLLKAHPNHPHRAEVEQVIAKAKEHKKMTAGVRSGDKPAM